jgi:hypothetical protein
MSDGGALVRRQTGMHADPIIVSYLVQDSGKLPIY